jgi:hypothetical protein
MKKPDITKGKWIHNKFRKEVISDYDIETMICEINYSGMDKDEETANAKAISAVPEMIEALIKVVKDHDDAWNLDAWNLLNVDTYNMCVKALEKAGVEL